MVSARRLVIQLCFVVALTGVLPLFTWLETFPRVAIAAGLLVGILQELKGRWQPRNWHLNLVLVPVFIWYVFQYSRSNPVQPVVSVLVIMLAVRLCGEKTIRNLMQINLLALFCLASTSLFDLSPSFLVWLALLLLLLPVSLVLMTFYAQNTMLQFTRKELGQIIMAPLLITVLTLPTMALLFPVLPRTAFPLWSFLAPPASGTGGMSEKVEPGTVQSIAETGALAFRAETQRLVQPPYWRGTVFNLVSGSGWSRDPSVPQETVRYGRERVVQTIYPEPSLSRVLIGLDAAAELSLPWVRVSPDGVYEYQRGVGKRISYQVTSDTAGLLRSTQGINRRFYLKLSDEISEQTLQLAKQIRSDGRTDQERLELAERHFMNGGYRYSKQGLPTGKDAVHQFLFVTRQGHCEFFASSLAILLRAAGVPARLVGGYLGGTYNEVGGYYLVRQDMAHVWVEAYLEGKGWQRTDPSRFAENAGAVWSHEKKPTLVMQLQLLFDAFDYRWNRAVVTYDFERQTGQIRVAGEKLYQFEQALKARWKKVLGALFLGILLLYFLKGGHLSWLWVSQEERLLRRFRGVLEKRFGPDLFPLSRGLFEVARLANDKRISQFVAIYGAAVYQDTKLTPVEVEQLKKLLDELSVVNK